MSDEGIDLDHLLTCGADELAEHVSDMSVAQCEWVARGILERVGGPRFERYLQCIAETMAPPDGGEPPETIDGYYYAARNLFPHVEQDDGTLIANVYRCPFYEGFSEAGLKPPTIHKMCQAFADQESAKFEELLPNSAATLSEFRTSADGCCKEEYKLDI